PKPSQTCLDQMTCVRSLLLLDVNCSGIVPLLPAIDAKQRWPPKECHSDGYEERLCSDNPASA
ncbi:MAG: hypothetical protein ABSH28_21245, partial [Acidobacteriota bacterium]